MSARTLALVGVTLVALAALLPFGEGGGTAAAAGNPPDTDGDGCADGAELGPHLEHGGQRNPANPWDFYDVNGDRVVSVFDDIIPVAEAFGSDTGPNYAPTKDRSPPPSPAEEPDSTKREPWDLGPPDGVINLFDDIFGVSNQFGHSCELLPLAGTLATGVEGGCVVLVRAAGTIELAGDLGGLSFGQQVLVWGYFDPAQFSICQEGPRVRVVFIKKLE